MPKKAAKKSPSTKKERGGSDFAGGMTLGQIVIDRTRDTGAKIKRLQQEARSHTFLAMGEMMQCFLDGQTRFVAARDVDVSGEPARVLELCRGDGLSIHELKLDDRPTEEVLAIFQELTASLSYLMLKGAVVSRPVGYIPPDFKGVESVLDMKELAVKFPDLKEWVSVGEFVPGQDLAVGAVIVAVDVVVVVLDIVQVSYDRPIDLLSRR